MSAYNTINLYFDGNNVTASLSDIELYEETRVITSIIYGTVVGMLGVFFIFAFLTSTRRARYTTLFLINMSAIIIKLIAALLYCQFERSIVFSGLLYQFYVEVDNPPGIEASGLARLFFNCLGFVLIEVALVLQVSIVYAVNPLHKRIALIGTSIIAFITCAVKISAETIDWYYNYSSVYNLNINAHRYEYISQGVFAFSVFVFCALFVGKLRAAQNTRRHLLMDKKFNTLDVVMMVGCEMLVVPTLMLIITVSIPDSVLPLPNFYVIVEALLLISMPFSGIWAARVAADTAAASQWTGPTGAIPSIGSSRYRNKDVQVIKARQADTFSFGFAARSIDTDKQSTNAKDEWELDFTGDSQLYPKINTQFPHGGITIRTVKVSDAPSDSASTASAVAPPSPTLPRNNNSFQHPGQGSFLED